MPTRNAYCWSLLALLALNSATFALPSEPPQWFGNIGVKRLADFFPTDVAIGPNGSVHYTDVSRKSVFRYSASGELELEIEGLKGFIRGLVVDSQGRIYVSANDLPDLFVYSPEGVLLDTWVGIGGSGFGTVDDQDKLYFEVGQQVAVFDTDGTELWRFGSTGSGSGEFQSVSDVAVAPDGSIWVVDEVLHKLEKYDTNGHHLLTVGRQGSGPGEFKMPVAVGVDSLGHVYVSDRRNSRIQKFDADGHYVTSWGSDGIGPGQFHESHGLDIGPDDTVWVAGFHAYSIQQFDQHGKLLAFWQGDLSGPGGFSLIRGIEVVDGVLFASDKMNNRVQALNAYTGKYLYEFGKRGQGDSAVFNFPRGLDAGPDGHLYVPDDGHTRRFKPDGTFVDRYSFRAATGGQMTGGQDLVVDKQGILFQANSPKHTAFKIDTNVDDGKLLLEWGGLGSGAGEFREPFGVTIGADDNLYFAEKGNSRVQIFDKDGNFVAFWGPGISGAQSIERDSQRDVYYVGGWSNVTAIDSLGAQLFRWGSGGAGIGEFSGVADIEVDDNGVLYIADARNARVHRYVYPPSDVNPAGSPDYTPGASTGIFVWKETYDGHYKLRTSSDGTGRRFLVKLVATLPFEHVSPINLNSNDALTVKENLILFDSLVSTWEDGIDFLLPPDAQVLISAKQDGLIKHGLIRIGSTNSRPPLAGWILSPTELPPSPAFRGGVDAGLFLGTGADLTQIEARLNGNGTSVRKKLSLISAGAPMSTVPVGLESCCDRLHTGMYEACLDSSISTWWDGIDITLSPESEKIAIAFSDGGLFPAHMVNPNINHDLGIPGAYSIPRAGPSGEPSFDSATEQGLFIWKDETGNWQLRMTAGGSSARYTGAVASDVPPLRVDGVSLEATDVLDITDPLQVRFDVRVYDSWTDGLSLSYPPGANITLELTEPTNAAHAISIGEARWPIESLPLQLEGQ